MFSGNVRRIATVVSAEDRASATLARTSAAGDDAAESMEGAAGGARRMRGAFLAAGAATSALVAGLGALVQVHGQTEQTFARMAEVSGATSEEMGQITSTAKEIGATLPISMGQAAGAMEQLSFAGFNAEQSMEAASGAADLAVASSLNMSEAARTTGTMVRAFGLEADNTAAITGSLAQTFSSSAANVRELQSAINRAAPAANNLGVSIQETSAAVGVLADRGIRGRRAATSLRNTFNRLVEGDSAETLSRIGVSMSDITDQEGNLRSMEVVLGELREGFNSLEGSAERSTVATELVGRRGRRALLPLLEDVDSFGEKMRSNFQAEIEETIGRLNEMDETELSNLSSALDMEDTIDPSEFGATDLAEQLTTLREQGMGSAEMTDLLMNQFDLTSEAAQRLTTSVQDQDVSYQDIGESISDVTTAQDIAAAQMDTTQGAITFLRSSLDTMAFTIFEGAAPAIQMLNEFLARGINVLNSNESAMRAVGSSLIALTGIFAGLTAAIGGSMVANSAFGAAASGVFSTISSFIPTLGGLAGMFGTVGAAITSTLGSLTSISGIMGLLSTAGAGLSSALTAVASAAGAVLSPLLAIVAIVGAVYASFRSLMTFWNNDVMSLRSNVMAIADAFTGAGGAITSVWEGVKDPLFTVLDVVGQLVGGAVAGAVATIVAFARGIMDAFGNVRDTIQGVIDATDGFANIRGLVMSIVGAVSMLTDESTAVGGVIATIGGFLADAGQALGQFVGWLMGLQVEILFQLLGALDGVVGVLMDIGGAIASLPWEPVFSAIATVGGVVADVLGTIGGLIVDVGAFLLGLPIQAVQSLAQFWLDSLTAVIDFVAGLGPVQDAISTVQAAIAGLGSMLSSVFGGIFGAATDAAADAQPIFSRVASVVGDVASTVGGALSGAFDAAMSALQPVFSVGGQIVGVLGQVARVFGMVAAGIALLPVGILVGFGVAMVKIASVVYDVIAGLTDWSAVLSSLAGVITGVGSAILDGFVAQLQLMGEQVGNVIDLVTAVLSGDVGGIADAGASIVRTFAEGILNVANIPYDALRNVLPTEAASLLPDLEAVGGGLMDDLAAGIQSFASSPVEAIQSALSILTNPGELLSNAVTFGEDAMLAISDGVMGATDAVADALSGIPIIGDAAGLYNEAINGMLGLGQAAMGAVADGLRQQIGLVTEQFGNITDLGGAILSGDVGGVMDAGSSIVRTFVNGMLNLANLPLDVLRAILPTEVAEYIPDLESVGSELIGGLVGGIQSVIDDPMGAVREAFAFLSSPGDILSNAVTMGEGVILALSDGMMAATDMVADALSGIPIIGGIAGFANDGINAMLGFGQDVIGAFADGIRGAISLVTTHINEVINLFSSLLSGDFAGAAEAGQAIVDNLVGGITDAVSAVVSAMSDVAGAIASFLPFSNAERGPLSSIMSVGDNIVGAIVDGIYGAVSMVTGAMGAVGGAIQNAIDAYIGFVTGVGQQLIGLIVDGVRAYLSNVRAALGMIGGAIRDAIDAYIGLVTGVGRTLVETLTSGVRSYINLVTQAFGFIENAIDRAITGYINLVTGVGRTIVDTIAGGIRGAVNTVVGPIRDVASTITDFLPFSNANRGPLSNIMSVGGNITSAIANGLRSGVSAVTSAASAVAGAIGDALSGAVDAAAGVADGITSAVSNGVDGAVSAAQGVGSDAADAVGSGISAVSDAGSDMANEVASGISDGADAVGNAASGMVDAAGSMLPGSDAERGPLSNLTDAGPALVDTFAQGIQSNVGMLGQAVKSGAEQAGRFLPLGGVGQQGPLSNLKRAGQKMVDTVSSGIQGNVGQIGQAVEQGASQARQFLPFSDAEQGPLADLTESGESLMATIASGVQGEQSAVADAVTSSMDGVIPQVSGQAEGAGQSVAAGMGQESQAPDAATAAQQAAAQIDAESQAEGESGRQEITVSLSVEQDITFTSEDSIEDIRAQIEQMVESGGMDALEELERRITSGEGLGMS